MYNYYKYFDVSSFTVVFITIICCLITLFFIFYFQNFHQHYIHLSFYPVIETKNKIIRTISRAIMAIPGTSAQQYYASEEEGEEEITSPIIPAQERRPTRVRQPHVFHPPMGGDTLSLILSKINEINTKIDNLSSRIGTLEQSNRAILDTVMEMKRSFPKYATVPISSVPGFDRRLA